MHLMILTKSFSIKKVVQIFSRDTQRYSLFLVHFRKNNSKVVHPDFTTGSRGFPLLVEDEVHFLVNCPQYENLREPLLVRDQSKFTGYLGRGLRKIYRKKSLRPLFKVEKFPRPPFFSEKSLHPLFLVEKKSSPP